MNKQIIVIRKDLKMRRGKEIAAGAHASLACILNLMKSQNGISEKDGTFTYTFSQSNPNFHDWMMGHFRKITVTVNSEQELLDLYDKAQAAGIVCSKILDSGFTEFHGVKTYTAIALGPDSAEVLDPLTGSLPLY